MEDKLFRPVHRPFPLSFNYLVLQTGFFLTILVIQIIQLTKKTKHFSLLRELLFQKTSIVNKTFDLNKKQVNSFQTYNTFTLL